MSSLLRDRLHAAAATSAVSVSSNAIEVEVARRRRMKRRMGAAGFVVAAAGLGASLPFALSGSPQGTARLNVTPPPQPSATAGPSGKPTLRLSWSGQPHDGAAATVIGSGFRPGASVQIVPCVPNAECGFRPIATMQANSAGTFSARVTAHLLIHDLSGDTAMCAQDCKYVAESGNGAVSAETATFDLAVLPPASQQCSTPMLQLTYVGPGSSKPGSRSAVFRVRNTGTSPCWVYGPGGVGLDSQRKLPATGWTVDQSAPTWPPKVVTLQAGTPLSSRSPNRRARGRSSLCPNCILAPARR